MKWSLVMFGVAFVISAIVCLSACVISGKHSELEKKLESGELPPATDKAMELRPGRYVQLELPFDDPPDKENT